jgi:hypothetical protein
VNTVATRIFKARALLARLLGAPDAPSMEKKTAREGN